MDYTPIHIPPLPRCEEQIDTHLALSDKSSCSDFVSDVIKFYCTSIDSNEHQVFLGDMEGRIFSHFRSMNEGYFKPKGLIKIKSTFATEIFPHELDGIYQTQTQQREELTKIACDEIAELVRKGYIIKDSRFRENGGRTSNGYICN